MSDPSTNVKKRAQRSDDSILLRHMDDVVGTGPEEHLMSDFEHMKTSPHLTDVVVLRHEGDTANFSGLEITKTRKGFEVKNSTDFVKSFLNLYGLQNSKPTVNLGRRSTVMHWMVTITSTFEQPSENSSSRHLGDQTCNSPSNNYPPSPQPHDREHARSETVDTISQRHATQRNGWSRLACSEYERVEWTSRTTQPIFSRNILTDCVHKSICEEIGHTLSGYG